MKVFLFGLFILAVTIGAICLAAWVFMILINIILSYYDLKEMVYHVALASTLVIMFVATAFSRVGSGKE